MHVRKVATDRNTSTGAGVQGEASRHSAAKGAAGMNTCALTLMREHRHVPGLQCSCLPGCRTAAMREGEMPLQCGSCYALQIEPTQNGHALCHVRALHKARTPSKAMACRDRVYLAA